MLQRERAQALETAERQLKEAYLLLDRQDQELRQLRLVRTQGHANASFSTPQATWASPPGDTGQGLYTSRPATHNVESSSYLRRPIMAPSLLSAKTQGGPDPPVPQQTQGAVSSVTLGPGNYSPGLGGGGFSSRGGSMRPTLHDRDLDRMAKNIARFEPAVVGSHDTAAYLEDINFHLARFAYVTPEDMLYLIRATSSREVITFLRCQPPTDLADCHLISQALMREFDESPSKTGLMAAMLIKQGRAETPAEYYRRLRRAYFGARTEPKMEEEIHFKSLFISNLHPSTKNRLDIVTDVYTQDIRTLRDYAARSYETQRRGSWEHETPALFSVETLNSSRDLEGDMSYN